jgi:hypothetical protein
MYNDDDKINNDIYIELDCLIDTRLSVLYNIDKDLIKKLLLSGDYHNRIKDEFGYIDSTVFNKVYNRRDKSILNNASPTNMINMLGEYSIESRHSNYNYGDNSNVKLYLNVYPYKLNDEEITNMQIGISSLVNDAIEVEVVYMDDVQLSPSWINEHVGVVVMYDGIKWIERELSNDRLIKTPIPDIGMITPNIVSGRMIIDNRNIDGFYEDIIKNLSIYIKIHFLRVKEFSILN